jgi:hypothetical protein
MTDFIQLLPVLAPKPGSGERTAGLADIDGRPGASATS